LRKVSCLVKSDMLAGIPVAEVSVIEFNVDTPGVIYYEVSDLDYRNLRGCNNIKGTTEATAALLTTIADYVWPSVVEQANKDMLTEMTLTWMWKHHGLSWKMGGYAQELHQKEKGAVLP